MQKIKDNIYQISYEKECRYLMRRLQDKNRKKERPLPVLLDRTCFSLKRRQERDGDRLLKKWESILSAEAVYLNNIQKMP